MAKARRRQTDKLLAEWFWTDAWTGSRGHSLPMEPRGLYREMLTQAWRREAKLPNDHEEIRRIVGCSEKEWKRCWPKVAQFWIADPGDPASLVNVTQVVVYLEAKEAVASSKARAQAGAQALHERRKREPVSIAHAPAQAVPSVSVSDLSGKNPESVKAPTRVGSGAMAGMLPRDHLRHKVCGRICLHEQQFEQFVRKLGGDPGAAAEAIRTWASGVLETWELPPLMNKPIQGNNFQWWDARWIEWQGSPTAEKGAAHLPSVQTAGPCPHTPPCTHPRKCQQLVDIAAEKARGVSA